jgi:hypothetical protein
MKNMKSIKVIGYGLWVMGVLLVSMPAIAQLSSDPFAATAPTTTFQSTSALVGAGSDYSSNPTIGDDGTAAQPNAEAAQAAPMARKISGRHNLIENPGDNPIGDALLPLMLLLLGYMGYHFVVKSNKKVTE